MPLLLWAFAVSIAGGCEWTPIVRSIEPRQVAEGNLFVLQHEPIGGRDYLTVVEDYNSYLDATIDRDSLTVPQIHSLIQAMPRSMLDVETGDICRIPGEGRQVLRRYENPVLPVAPRGWRAVHLDGESDTLEFIDEHCEPQGPRVSTTRAPTVYQDPDTLDPHALVLTERGDLWRLNPWSGKRRKIAEGADAWQFLAGPPGPSYSRTERYLLLREAGVLVIRDLDGKRLASFGEDVAAFVQTTVGGLRVAYESGNAVYEVVAPDLTPVRLAGQDQAACHPEYFGTVLTFHYPCEDELLTRVDLLTGEVETLLPGVISQRTERGWTLQVRRTTKEGEDSEIALETWVRPPGGEDMRKLVPQLSSVRPLDSRRLVGMDKERNFGIWSEISGFTVVLNSVASVLTYEDTRLTPDREEPVFLWIAHHDVEDQVGKLSLLSAKDFSIQPIVEGVPVGGFTALQFAAVLDPALIILRDLEEDGATLDAKLIPELIGTTVDDGVIAFAPRGDQQEPGLYYTRGPGEREGIWFAPL